MIIINLVLPTAAFQWNCALPMPGTADGDATADGDVISRYQVGIIE